MLITVYVGLFSLLLVLLYCHISVYRDRKRYTHIPSHPIPITWKWILGHINLLWEKRSQLGDHRISNFSLLLDLIRKDLDSNTIVLFFANRHLLYTIHVPVVARVLGDHRTFMKVPAKEARLAYVNGERIFGDNGLLLEPGTEIWYHKRKMMDPAFQKKYLKCLMEDMTRIANKLCHYVGQKCVDGKIVDIYNIMNKAALEIVCTCGFSMQDDIISLEESEINKAAAEVLEIVPFSLRNSFGFWVPWKFKEEKERLRNANRFLRDSVRKILTDRIEANSKNPDSTSNDILDHIIRGNSFSDKISVEDILDDFVVFFVAGMETTAITMSCFVWLLLKHPEISQRVVEEVREVYGEKDEMEYEDLNKLVYLEQCLKECLRLHPPVQLGFRVSPRTQDVIVDNLLIPQRTQIVMSTEAIHYTDTLWPDPNKFDPDRFEPGKKIEPFTYLPFTAGPRQCIGKHFAIMEAKVVLAKLFHTFQFYDPYPEEKTLQKVTSFTSKPRNGVFVGVVS